MDAELKSIVSRWLSFGMTAEQIVANLQLAGESEEAVQAARAFIPTWTNAI